MPTYLEHGRGTARKSYQPQDSNLWSKASAIVVQQDATVAALSLTVLNLRRGEV